MAFVLQSRLIQVTAELTPLSISFSFSKDNGMHDCYVRIMQQYKYIIIDTMEAL